MNPPNLHGSLLTIDGDAIAYNWRLLSAKVKPVECAAVVKGDAYGLGIEAVVPVLARAGCRSFFVAHLEEGIRARKAAPMASIYVLNGMPQGSESIIQSYRLRPVLCTVSEVGRWKMAGGGPSALQVDTGMNRLGLSLDEAKALSMLHEWETIGIELLMSHLVASDEPEDDMNEVQITRFERVKEWFGDRIKRRSLANSSAHFLPSPPIFEMTRAGYALYGGNPTPGQSNPMKPVVSLEALIMQIRHVEPGETVGYNAQWTARRSSRIATISIGYADGWLRSLSAIDGKPGGAAMVNGVLCPFVGRVSMDLITLDVTDCPIADVRAGQRVTLIGEGISIDDVAVMAGTNGYEILTSLGDRYQRRITGA